MLNEIETARRNAEERLGFEIPTLVADYVLGYTMRKFLNILTKEQKPEGYLGVLYKEELENYFVRQSISAMSQSNRKESSYVC